MEKLLLKEVMLNKIDFMQDKNAVCFEFYDAPTGKGIGKVVCEDVFKMDMNTAFLYDEEKFPCFVLDVTYSQLKDNEVANYFNKLNYAFRNEKEPMIPQSDLYWYFRIEGGPVQLEVISSNIETKLLRV